jgi:multidrug efflux pump subunit AcrA (membrane-fusion protein)
MNQTCSESTIPSPPPDKILHRLRFTPVLLALFAAFAVIPAISCKKPAPTPPPPPIVQVTAITATDVPFSTEFIGQLDSPQNVEVRARVEAFVDKVLFTEGTEVKEGDPLFLLDKKPFESSGSPPPGVRWAKLRRH